MLRSLFPLSAITELLRVDEDRMPGPTPSYGKAHLVLCILAIGDAKIIGRQALAREVGIGEGATRTIIKRLKQSGYLTTIVSGCTPTAKGERLYLSIKSLLPIVLPIPHTKLSVGREQIAVLVRGVGPSVADGIEQRDEAVKIGADGATTFVFGGSEFRIPKASQDCESDYPDRIWAVLREKLQPKNGDAIILCGAETANLSKIGAVAAALTLLRLR